MTTPASPAGHIPLVEVTRGDLVESVHYGSFAVTDAAGQVQLLGGDLALPVYARSALKPFQATAMVRAGFDMPDDLLALASASHSGAAIHLDGVERMLALHGLTTDALHNVVDYPMGPDRETWIRAGKEKSRVAQGCSGKHAAMLATCVVNGWDIETYLDPSHPLQVHIKQVIEELTGERSAGDTTDGCGTPLPAFTLPALATAIAKLAIAEHGSADARVPAAIKAYPEMLAGEERDTTHLIRAVPGLFGKDGAEAVMLVGLESGLGIALKISDGGDRARMPFTVALLRELGIDAPALAEVVPKPIFGGGRPVGEIRAIQAAFTRE
ncbi:MAG: asparaginase [Leucobacter sp.]